MILKDVKAYFLVLIIITLVNLLAFRTVKYVPLLHQLFHDQCGTECIDRQLDDKDSSQYLIHTPTCDIPNIPLDHPSIAKYKVKEPPKIMCSDKKALTQELGLALKFYPERIIQYGLPSRNSIECFYQGIIRVEQDVNHYDKHCDKRWKLNDTRIPITEDLMLIDEDAIFVLCSKAADKEQKAIYKNVHYFIQPRRTEGKRKQKAVESLRIARPKRLSVILMGMDSVSRSNLLRNMPKTYDYLIHNMSAIDMRGYNKIGDNTYPNLVAILSGLTMRELQIICLPQIDNKYDDCPFIWKNYSQKGYVTAFAEDAPKQGIFHVRKTGFVKEPTDYYNAAYFLMSDETIGHFADGHLRICQGGKNSISVIQDYSLTLAESFKDVPTFELYWSSSITHNDVMRASRADQPCLEYLIKLHKGGYLEDTILFFLSDHGMRYGDIRRTYAGMLEERLPYMMVVLPKWFKEEYPEAVKNFHVNTRRLTSPFDIHATLHDILNHVYIDQSKSFMGNYGQSLFLEVPLNRTCEDSGINPHYCSCQTTTEADKNDPHLLGSASYTVKELNQGLRHFSACVHLNLDKVISGRVSSPSQGTKPENAASAIKNYIVIFVTQPGGAEMESSVLYDGGKYEMVGQVSRINAYGNQSHCINNPTYMKYCYCKDLLQ